MKFLFSPLKFFWIHQHFGENKACINNTTGKIISCDGLNPPAGHRSIYSQMKGHNGLDLQAGSWEACYNSQKGYAVEVSTEEARGLGVSIITEDKNFCNETQTKEHFMIRYWHFAANNVDVGQYVKTGDLVGYCDNTGYSSGDHLHWEIKPVKVTWKDGKPKKWSNILQDNGYFGAVDPLQYLETEPDGTPVFSVTFAGLWRQVKELIALLTDKLGDIARK
jgi:murein DD-endopeptidase MepM/ murein hydrolase activator NlpD